jgi:hypothetical protein
MLVHVASPFLEAALFVVANIGAFVSVHKAPLAGAIVAAQPLITIIIPTSNPKITSLIIKYPPFKILKINLSPSGRGMSVLHRQGEKAKYNNANSLRHLRCHLPHGGRQSTQILPYGAANLSEYLTVPSAPTVIILNLTSSNTKPMALEGALVDIGVFTVAEKSDPL